MVKTALMLAPIFILVGIAFWLIFPSKNPILISDQKSEIPVSNTRNISDLESKVDLLENKLEVLESSNSQLLTKINQINLTPSKTVSAPTGKKSSVLLPINPGGEVNSTNWTNLTSGAITVNPADYPGYKDAYLIINLSVNVGQGMAYARLVNTANTLAIIPSQVSTNSYFPITLTSGPFKLPAGSNNYTIQLYTLVAGYPAQAQDSFLQITY